MGEDVTRRGTANRLSVCPSQHLRYTHGARGILFQDQDFVAILRELVCRDETRYTAANNDEVERARLWGRHDRCCVKDEWGGRFETSPCDCPSWKRQRCETMLIALMAITFPVARPLRHAEITYTGPTGVKLTIQASYHFHSLATPTEFKRIQ